MKTKLDSGGKHLLMLVRKDRGEDGWTKVSSVVLPLVQDLPTELVTVELTEDGGRVRLTDAGETVLDWT